MRRAIVTLVLVLASGACGDDGDGKITLSATSDFIDSAGLSETEADLATSELERIVNELDADWCGPADIQDAVRGILTLADLSSPQLVRTLTEDIEGYTSTHC